MKFIKKHKKKFIIGAIALFVLLLAYIIWTMLPNSNKSLYGDRLDGIEDVEIKWPNDVLINGEKVSGILTEAIAKFNTIESIIVGVGLDVNLDLSDFSDDLQGKITSLKVITGKEFNENDIIRTFLEEFEKICKLFIDGEYENVLNQWRKRSYTIGKIVEVRKPYNKTYDGYVTGINKEGALIVEKIDGTLENVVSGECIIKK